MVERWIRRLRGAAAVLVVLGVVLILAGGDRDAAQSLLIGGLAYAVVSVILERRSRR